MTTQGKIRKYERNRGFYLILPLEYISFSLPAWRLVFTRPGEGREVYERRTKGKASQWLTFPFPFVHHQPLHIFASNIPLHGLDHGLLLPNIITSYPRANNNILTNRLLPTSRIKELISCVVKVTASQDIGWKVKGKGGKEIQEIQEIQSVPKLTMRP